MHGTLYIPPNPSACENALKRPCCGLLRPTLCAKLYKSKASSYRRLQGGFESLDLWQQKSGTGDTQSPGASDQELRTLRTPSSDFQFILGMPSDFSLVSCSRSMRHTWPRCLGREVPHDFLFLLIIAQSCLV